MLWITVPAAEVWDEKSMEFFTTKEQKLQLENSLVSISKWEAKWQKSFFSREPKTLEETIDYIKCMTITQNVDPNVYRMLSNQNIKDIQEYIEAPMTATTFSERSRAGGRETVTSELIYYWMVALNIPFECQKWHINRLLTLIRICNIKNQPDRKRSRREIINQNAALNAARRKKFNTKG